MKRLTLAPVLALSMLSACGGTAELYSVPPAQVTPDSMRISYSSVEVRQVSLPSYAASEEIHVRGADGSLSASSSLLWSDDPTRSVTLELSRYLAQLTGAQVAAEPWPFYDPAQAKVEVRVEEMLADSTGVFLISGQYFVAPDSGRRDRSGLFTLTAPIQGDGGSLAIAAARGVVVRDLAMKIARDGLR